MAMAAVVGHLGHDALTDVLGAPADHGGRLPSCCLDSLHAKLVDSLRQLIRDIMGA
jgi:hypothetical protein